jgi:monovalent cation:H+ antiporter-2, CPA2 family
MPFVNEALELLAATAIVIPLFRRLRLSPILGFLVAGVVLGPHGFRIVKDVEDITELAEFGVLFLLFEMGLQLNIDRLRKLRKYAFGMGTLQVTLTALVLGLGAYAMNASIPEAAVIGAALSLSSSAFILQLLAEKGERQSRAGVAVFGVLLFQGNAHLQKLPALGISSGLVFVFSAFFLVKSCSCSTTGCLT